MDIQPKWDVDAMFQRVAQIEEQLLKHKDKLKEHEKRLDRHRIFLKQLIKLLSSVGELE